jgi:hypothetical protein
MIFSSTDDGVHWKKDTHECQCPGQPGFHDCASDPGYVSYPHHNSIYRLAQFPALYGDAIFHADNTGIACGYGGSTLRRDPVTGVWQDRTQHGSIYDSSVSNTVVTLPMYGATTNGGNGSTGIGLIVGLGGTLRETINGGQDWFDSLKNGPSTPPSTVHQQPWRIQDVQFLDVSAGETGFQVGQFARIGRTTDGGVNWDHASQAPNQYAQLLRGITFASASTQRGVAVGNTPYPGLPTILYTVTGGTPFWLTVPPASITLLTGGVTGSLFDVAFAGIIILTGKADYWAAGQYGLILHSRDDGATWSQYMPPGPGGTPSQPTDFQINGVAFKDLTTGIFVGRGPEPLGQPLRAVAYQYKKPAGGAVTWTNISPATPNYFSTLSDVVIVGNTAYAVGDEYHILTGFRKGVVLVSTIVGTDFIPFAPLTDATLPTFSECTTNDSHNDIGETPVLIEAEIAPSSELWVGGQCGRVWRRTAGVSGVWSEFKSQTDTHILGISFPVCQNNYGYFWGHRTEQPQQCGVRYTP